MPLSVRNSSGPLCPYEPLEAGPQAGSLPPAAVRCLPALLRRFRTALDDTPVTRKQTALLPCCHY